ncbi:MAG: phosphatidylglycerophosphatase A [Rhodobacteraceae bacterium]|nr:phosphatidylglycerophosphatase A [Paracoccaceae bacterium]
MARNVATLFGIGNIRPAPGTWGALVSLPLAWALHALGGPWLLLLAIVASFPIGLWAAKAECAACGEHDPSQVVIDELCGQWIALWPVSFGAAHVGVDVLRLWPGWVAAFVLFRLFDITKPSIIGKADRRGDTMGLMLDDVLAGLAAAIGVILLAVLAHKVLL